MSGICPSDDAKKAYLKVKLGKSAFGVFEIQDEKSVECTYLAEKATFEKGTEFTDYESHTWQHIVAYVEENLKDKAAYVVTDIKFETKDEGRQVQKLTMISWCPENKIKVKPKMLHGSSLNACKQTFDGIAGKPLQASSVGDLEFENILGDLKSN